MIQEHCEGCHEWLPLSAFSFHRGNGTHYTRCKACRAADARAYRQTADYQAAERRRKRRTAAQ